MTPHPLGTVYVGPFQPLYILPPHEYGLFCDM